MYENKSFKFAALVCNFVRSCLVNYIPLRKNRKVYGSATKSQEGGGGTEYCFFFIDVPKWILGKSCDFPNRSDRSYCIV